MYWSTQQAVRFAFGIVAAIIFIVAGLNMLSIESRGSVLGTRSIDEVFYQAFGVFSFGMAALAVVIAIPVTPAGEPLTTKPKQNAKDSRSSKRRRASVHEDRLESEIRSLGRRADRSQEEKAMVRLTSLAEEQGLRVEDYETWIEAAEAIVESIRGE